MLEKLGIYFIDYGKMRDNAIIVDAGACKGTFIEQINEKIEKGKIIEIECDRENIEALKEKNFPNVTICEKALMGHKPKKKMIYNQYIGFSISGTVGYERTYIKEHRDFKGINKYEVETLEINNIFSEFNIDRIDYMKMNIEGSERDILAAMTEETASRIDQISISTHANILLDLTASPLRASANIDVIKRLTQLGFKAFRAGRRLIYGIFDNKEA